MERAAGNGSPAEADLLTLSAGMSSRAITERILERADEPGGRAALIDAPEGTVTLWPRFASMVRAAAAGLSRRGLSDGDTAGVFVGDAASFAIAVNAIRAAGALAVAIRPDASPTDVAAQLNVCGARALITSATLADAAAQAADRSRVRQVFAFGDAPGTTSFRTLLGSGTRGADRGLACRGFDHRGLGDRGFGDRSLDDRSLDDRGLAADTASVAGLSRRDVVVAGPPCGEGHAYTSLVDLTLLTGATLVAAPVPLLVAAMRVYKGTAAIVPRDTRVPGISPDRIFAVV